MHVDALEFKWVCWVKMFASSNLFIACCSNQLVDEGSEVERGTLMVEV